MAYRIICSKAEEEVGSEDMDGTLEAIIRYADDAIGDGTCDSVEVQDEAGKIVHIASRQM